MHLSAIIFSRLSVRYFAVDYSATVAVLTYKVKIVESADEIPSPDALHPKLLR